MLPRETSQIVRGLFEEASPCQKKYAVRSILDYREVRRQREIYDYDSEPIVRPPIVQVTLPVEKFELTLTKEQDRNLSIESSVLAKMISDNEEIEFFVHKD